MRLTPNAAAAITAALQEQKRRDSRRADVNWLTIRIDVGDGFYLEDSTSHIPRRASEFLWGR